MICKCFPALCGLFFHSLNTIFCRAKVIHFTEIPIINFSYDRLFFLVLLPKNYLPNWRSGRFFLFPTMTLKVLCFHLSLQCILYNFVWSMRYVYTYIFIHIDVQLFQNHFLKRMLLFHWTVFVPFSNSIDHICSIYVLALFFVPLICLSVLWPNNTTLITIAL